MSKLQSHLVSLVLLAASCSTYAADTTIPYLKKGMSIQRANKALLLHGWKPDPEKMSREDPLWPKEKRIFKSGITAVEYCAIDVPLCNYKYKKKGKCLQITSRGKALRHLKLDYWTNDCDVGS